MAGNIDFNKMDLKIGDHLFIRATYGTKYIGKINDIQWQPNRNTCVILTAVIVVSGTLSGKPHVAFRSWDCSEAIRLTEAEYTGFCYLYHRHKMVMDNFKKLMKKIR